MTTDGISQIMCTYPSLITENTRISGIHKGWLDILNTFCSNVSFIASITNVGITLTEIKDKYGALKVNFSVKDAGCANQIYSLITDLALQLEHKSLRVDLKTGEYAPTSDQVD